MTTSAEVTSGRSDRLSADQTLHGVTTQDEPSEPTARDEAGEEELVSGRVDHEQRLPGELSLAAQSQG